MNAASEWLPVALRDTALTVADLSDADRRPSAVDLLEEGKKQMARLRAELQMRGLPPDVIEDAVYAQCALLDETALRSFVGTERDTWEHNPLQLGQFDSNDAGEELVRRIEGRLSGPRPVRLLLEIFAAVLDLGFTGRFAVEGQDARARLRQAIDDRLGVRKSDDDDDASIIVKAAIKRPWTSRISPLTCIALACVVTGIVWIAIDTWLDASIALMGR
ncbi:DotU family type IV/VI secretion system protein [Caballeronia catudaia]|uniref:DotU family type IV/VI secretion system protein n=1 Tax=Caballeronia catudaia TaxID=1777136 RepID=A0A158DPV8_9BURK|nr:DotU family type IV/VI secretion system protein [Caballeronia catudaia]SAK96638.1 DotU family type IV/VI secretion system protein [Caballeronia catudaia]